MEDVYKVVQTNGVDIDFSEAEDAVNWIEQISLTVSTYISPGWAW
jgi:3D (Asp-Asp-Asp) domain-containing protein